MLRWVSPFKYLHRVQSEAPEGAIERTEGAIEHTEGAIAPSAPSWLQACNNFS